MGFFTSLIGQKKEKYIYLAGWEAEFNWDEQCQKFLETQVVDKKIAKSIWSSIELVFQDDKLKKIYNIDDGDKAEIKLKESELGFKYQNIDPHEVFNLSQVSKSESCLGGEIPQ